MEAKLFEVSDRATRLVCVGMRTARANLSEKETKLMRHAGFGSEMPLVIFMPLYSRAPLMWDWRARQDRTLAIAHKYAWDNWEHLRSGDMIDVEHILGETEFKKKSDILNGSEDGEFGGIEYSNKEITECPECNAKIEKLDCWCDEGFDGHQAWQTHMCRNCLTEWHTVYKFSHSEVHDDQRGEV